MNSTEHNQLQQINGARVEPNASAGNHQAPDLFNTSAEKPAKRKSRMKINRLDSEEQKNLFETTTNTAARRNFVEACKLPPPPPPPEEMVRQEGGAPSIEKEFLVILQHHGSRVVRGDDIEKFLGASRTVTEECRKAGWLQPRVETPKYVIFDLFDVVRCARRLLTEGRPAAAPESLSSQKGESR